MLDIVAPTQQSVPHCVAHNDKLPLWASKSHPHPGSHLCPSCKQEGKDIWHFLKCTHMEWHCCFNTLKQKLTNFTSQYTLHLSLLTTFWLGLLAIQKIPHTCPTTRPTTHSMVSSPCPGTIRLGPTLSWTTHQLLSQCLQTPQPRTSSVRMPDIDY